MAEDDYQKALDEAQQLMQDLGTENVGSFAIDSDDEGEDINLNDDDNDPLRLSLDLHPLAEGVLPVATTSSSQASTPMNGSMNGSAGVSPVSTPAGSLPNSGTSTPLGSMSMPPQQPFPSQHLPVPQSTAYAPSSTTATPLDAWQSKTKSFASNFGSMVRSAATQVVAGAAGLPPDATGVWSPATPSLSTASSHSNLAAATLPSVAPLPPQPELDNEQKATLVATHVGDLLPGERVIMFLSSLMHVADSTGVSYAHDGTTMWCAAMTYYRLIVFATHPAREDPRPPHWNAACWPPPVSNQVLQIPLSSIDKIEKSVFSTTGPATNPTTVMGLVVYGKDNGRQLRLTTPSYADTLRAYEALSTYAFPGRRNLGYLFAFESKREAVMASIVEDAAGKKTVMLEPFAKRFDGPTEFGRQFSKGAHPWAIWTTVNGSYQTCMSYPSVLAGPASIDEASPEGQRLIRQCAAFRSESRLPALTWAAGIDGASLWRASQPRIGLQGNRSPADELFLKHILESASSANAMAGGNPERSLNLSRAMLVQLTGSVDLGPWLPESPSCLKILDLRPRSSAMANRTGGYGYENTSNYPGTTLQFCNIGNIHAVRDSYQKLSAVCTSPATSDITWHASIEDTKWLSHIRLILAAGWEAAFWIYVHRLPVLLHCSHGWDRTSQVAVIAQLLLDDYYRTRQGFACLVEKDFMSFGHPFHTRCAHGEGRGGGEGQSNDEGQISPIFLQFLDCVYQLVAQYPECFEFNTKYLLCLSEHIYSCRFGNFLCDTEREREMVAGIRQRTHSLFDYLDGREDLHNAAYDAQCGCGVLLMPLPTLLRNVHLWADRHCRYGPKPTIRWLPQGVEARPEPKELAQDQQSALTTAQETWQLIGTMEVSNKEE